MANDDLRDKLVTYIQDTYALENQIVDVLEKHEKDAQEYPDIQAMVHRHLEETKQHRQRMEQRLAAYNEKPSAMKDVAANLMANLIGALSGWRTDAVAKNARDEYVTEHMEIAAYGLLMATAEAYGDTETVHACSLNLADEIRMASLLEQQFPRIAILALRRDKIDVSAPVLQQSQSSWQRTLDQIHQELESPLPGSAPSYGEIGPDVTIR
jgi:ferritin-like metal-binding protein YciE